MKKQKKKRCIGYDLAKWSAALVMVPFFRPKKHYPFGKPINKGKLIISSNHIGPLDPVQVAMVLPLRRIWTLTRGEVFQKKFYNWVFRTILCIPIDRENPSMDTYREIMDLLNQGKVVLFFSEGHINFNDNQIRDYKMGTAFFAAMTGAPVIPVYIVRRKNFLQRAHMIVGKELWIKDICDGMPSMPEIEKFNEYIREQECALEKWKDEYLGK